MTLWKCSALPVIAWLLACLRSYLPLLLLPPFYGYYTGQPLLASTSS